MTLTPAPNRSDPAAAAPDTALVRTTGLHKHYGQNHVLRGIDLAVQPHETVAVIGRSGGGKTTLLRCLNFLEEPTMGSVRIGDITVDADPLRARSRRHREQIRHLRMRAGMVFQEFNLFPHMTVLQNCIEAPMRVRGIPRSEATETAARYLAKVHLTDKTDEFPTRLSSGQKQRAAIARALCMEPEVLLFDEPTSALDPELVGEVLRVMEDLAREGTTMIVVTHEMQFAREAAGRVVFIEGGQILEDGPPSAVLDSPQRDETRQFLRRLVAR
jgi:ABC-type polar amino acid transport system ATPase subunit